MAAQVTHIAPEFAIPAPLVAEGAVDSVAPILRVAQSFSTPPCLDHSCSLAFFPMHVCYRLPQVFVVSGLRTVDDSARVHDDAVLPWHSSVEYDSVAPPVAAVARLRAVVVPASAASLALELPELLELGANDCACGHQLVAACAPVSRHRPVAAPESAVLVDVYYARLRPF